jgi:hypothetical protein
MEEQDIAFFISGDEETSMADAKKDFIKTAGNVKFFIEINDVAFQKVWFLLAYSPKGAKKFYKLLYLANYVLTTQEYNLNSESLLKAANFANERVAPKITALKKLLKNYEKLIAETRTEPVVEERPRETEKKTPQKYAKLLKEKLLAEYKDDEPMTRYINASISKRGGGGAVTHKIQNLLAGFFNRICKIHINYDEQNNQISADLVDKRLNKYSKSILPIVVLYNKTPNDTITVDDSIDVSIKKPPEDKLGIGFDIDFITGQKNSILLSAFYKYTGYFVVVPFGVAGVSTAVPFIVSYFLGQKFYENVIKPNLKKTLLMNNLKYNPSIKNCMRLLIPVVINKHELKTDTTSTLKLRFDIQPPVSAIKTLEKEYQKSQIVSMIQNNTGDIAYTIKPSLKNFLTILKPINKIKDEVMLHSKYSIDRRVDELLTQSNQGMIGIKEHRPYIRGIVNRINDVESNKRKYEYNTDSHEIYSADDGAYAYEAEITLDHKPSRIQPGGNNSSPKYSNILVIDENTSTTPIKKIYYCSDKATENFVSDSFTDDILSYSYSSKKEICVKWKIPQDSTVLIIGDIHGDINALESVLNRWIEKKLLFKDSLSSDTNPKYILSNKVFVISTGDLIDYGSKSLNVLCAMLRLRNDNKSKVMLLCGNHETPDTRVSGKPKFYYDLSKTIKDLDKLTRIATIIRNNISNIGPDMLALHFGDEIEGTYFMHGMYPFVYNIKKKSGEKDYYDYYDETESAKAEEILNSLDLTVSDLIQWNDLSEENNGITIRTDRQVDGIVKVGHTELIDIMNKYMIKGIIRGHQDMCGVQSYPLDKYNTCGNTINMTNDRDHRNCKENSTEDNLGWCTNSDKQYRWAFIANPSEIKERVITLSMAFEKSKISQPRAEYNPPMGGYIQLTSEIIDDEFST